MGDFISHRICNWPRLDEITSSILYPDLCSTFHARKLRIYSKFSKPQVQTITLIHVWNFNLISHFYLLRSDDSRILYGELRVFAMQSTWWDELENVISSLLDSFSSTKKKRMGRDSWHQHTIAQLYSSSSSTIAAVADVRLGRGSSVKT